MFVVVAVGIVAVAIAGVVVDVVVVDAVVAVLQHSTTSCRLFLQTPVMSSQLSWTIQ